MSFDALALARLCVLHGRVARIVVAEVKGSAPREPGAAVLVWEQGQEGTIGGGALEHRAVEAAREALRQPGPPGIAASSQPLPRDRAERLPLGPALGQCCGGAVLLVTEFWDKARLASLGDELYARPLPGTPAPVTGGETAPPLPLAVARRLAGARNGAVPGAARRGTARRADGTEEAALVQGWLVEPMLPAARPLWIWGAGHVGRALVSVMAPLPGWSITWADTARPRFPDQIPDGVAPLMAQDLPAAARLAPPEAHHLILTYSHAIDLELCHALLGRGFGFAGLIGSDSKWARFRSRLLQLGHQDAAISRICCPIGRKSFGKHPQAIAIGVAADLLWRQEIQATAKDAAG